MSSAQVDSQRAGWGWSLLASSEESETYAAFLAGECTLSFVVRANSSELKSSPNTRLALLRYNPAKVTLAALGFVAMSYADLEYYGATHGPGESPFGVDWTVGLPHPAWFSRLGDDERVRKTVAFLVDLLEVLPSRMWNESAQKFVEGPDITLAALYDAYAQAQIELGVDERFRVPLRKDLVRHSLFKQYPFWKISDQSGPQTNKQIDPRYFKETDVASDEFIEGKDLRIFCWRHRCGQTMCMLELPTSFADSA